MSIDLEINVQDAKFIAALLRGAGAQKEWTDELTKSAKASAALEKSLDNAANRVQRRHGSPAENLAREQRELDELMRKAKISQETHARAVQAAREKAFGKPLRGAADTGLDAAMDMAGSLGVVTSAAGVAAIAVQGIGEAFRFTAEQGRKAADEMDKLFALRRTLNQVAESPEDLQKMINEADAASQKYGISRERAHAIRADVRGLGIDNQFDSIAQAEAGAVSAHDASKMVKKVLAIYGDKEKDLNARSIIDMTLNAAKKSSLSFEDLAGGVAQASEGGAVVGSSSTETVSALSVLGGKFASVQTAADRMKGFSARAGIDDRLKGKGMLGAMRTLRDEFTAEERKKFLGDSQELNVMYQYLVENEKAIDDRQKEVEASKRASSAGKGEVSQAMERAKKNSGLSAVIRKNQAEVSRDIAQEIWLGEYGQSTKAGLATTEGQHIQARGSWISRTAAQRAATIASYAVPGEYLPSIGRLASSSTGNPFAAVYNELAGGFGASGGNNRGGNADPAAAAQIDAAQELKSAAQDLKGAAKRGVNMHNAAQQEAAAAIT